MANSIRGMKPVSDLAPARWVMESIPGFDFNVSSLVPECFAAYARILHPARMGDEVNPRPVQWADVARANGRLLHPRAQFRKLVPPGHSELERGQPRFWDETPRVGSLPSDVAQRLVEVLEKYTSTPQSCWFGIWDGYGDVDLAVAGFPTFTLPHRSYYLLRGPIEGMAQSVREPLFTQSPNLCWPDDRSWFVATEIDLDSTYLGASSECVRVLMRTPGLEVLQAAPTDGITWDSDDLNP